MNLLSAPFGAKIAVALFAGAIVVGGSVSASAAVIETVEDVVTATVETPDEDGTDGVVDEGETDEGTEDGADDGTEEGTDGDAETHGPDATGDAAWGLCNARSHGGLPGHSTAGEALDAAADGDVDAYCATVEKHHGDEADDEGDETTEDSEDAADDDAATEHGKSGHSHGKGHGHGHKH